MSDGQLADRPSLRDEKPFRMIIQRWDAVRSRSAVMIMMNVYLLDGFRLVRKDVVVNLPVSARHCGNRKRHCGNRKTPARPTADGRNRQTGEIGGRERGSRRTGRATAAAANSPAGPL